MNILKIRSELRNGRTIFDIPLRVTFYARVSTDKDEQINSLENQVQYYTELIQSKPSWAFVPGYVDEGISGTSTKKRDSFLRMIADAKAGRFDFIITKEISRFSRSTLDSIRYTQELLEHGVGVLFQNDNINTLDSDSEFRLVVMAGVAQDEVRKLSERLKFGFRQAIKNGHVLGNDKLWGYDKKDCVLTINEEEAQVVRRIFDLYANQQMGIRRISQKLLDEGFTSRKGNAFNVLTIRHILCNPKYKGWYCANKSQTVDYRSKRKIFLDESEWVMYPDPSIPAIVSEELWDRANALYKRRSEQMMSHQSAAEFHNRYPYSGKIICEEHGTTFHRQLQKSKAGEKEVWQCRVYRNRGRAACSARNCSKYLSGSSHSPSVMNTISAFSKPPSSISSRACSIGVWKSVPPFRKVSAARSLSSMEYSPGWNTSTLKLPGPEKWIKAKLRPLSAAISSRVRATAFPHAVGSPSVESDSSRQQIISPMPL